MGVMSIREFNSNVSKAIARVERGETLDITRNGKVIAELRPKGPIRDEKWWKAWHETDEVLRKGFPLGIGKVTHEDKYGDADLG
jgi:antitoxin (DNA-binding transcriptional repressor) of toxin-antitoxin stability system